MPSAFCANQRTKLQNSPRILAFVTTPLTASRPRAYSHDRYPQRSPALFMRPKNIAWHGNHIGRGSTVSLKVPLRNPPLLVSRRKNSLLFMKTKLLPFLTATLLLVPVLARANDIEPSKEFYT